MQLNTTPGAVRSVLGNSLDNVTADYATALNNSVLTVKSSMKESMRRIHEMAPTLTSTVKTQRNIAGLIMMTTVTATVTLMI